MKYLFLLLFVLIGCGVDRNTELCYDACDCGRGGRLVESCVTHCRDITENVNTECVACALQYFGLWNPDYADVSCNVKLEMENCQACWRNDL